MNSELPGCLKPVLWYLSTVLWSHFSHYGGLLLGIAHTLRMKFTKQGGKRGVRASEDNVIKRQSVIVSLQLLLQSRFWLQATIMLSLEKDCKGCTCIFKKGGLLMQWKTETFVFLVLGEVNLKLMNNWVVSTWPRGKPPETGAFFFTFHIITLQRIGLCQFGLIRFAQSNPLVPPWPWWHRHAWS